MEHRWGERIPVDFHTRVTAHPFCVRAGRLTDLSVSGAHIEGDFDVRPLTRIQVAILHAKWAKHDAQFLDAYVTRKERGGLGIEWCEFAPAEVSRLLEEVVKRPHALRRHAPPSPAVVISRVYGNLLKHGH